MIVVDLWASLDETCDSKTRYRRYQDILEDEEIR